MGWLSKPGKGGMIKDINRNRNWRMSPSITITMAAVAALALLLDHFMPLTMMPDAYQAQWEMLIPAGIGALSGLFCGGGGDVPKWYKRE